MRNKGYLFLVLIFLVCILSVSAVSAAEDLASDINTDDSQELILEENIGETVSTSADDNQELTAVSDNVDDSTGNTKLETSTKVSEKSKVAAKADSKKKTDFKTIKKGSKDKVMVKKIQRALKKNGYYLKYKGHYLKIDGWYGPYTFRSVKQFQKAKGLKVTGNVDEKTAEKLKIIDKSNAIIKLEKGKTFKREYNSGRAFDAKIVKRSNGRGIETILRVDYIKNGKNINYEFYCTDNEGINYITPDRLKVGTYKAIVSCDEPGIKAIPKTKTVIITKTSIRLKASDIKVSGNKNAQLKATLKFKNNAKVNEGKVKFTIDGKSYIVKVKNGIAVKNLKSNNIKSKKYTVEFLGTKNIKGKSATGKIA